MTVVDRLAFVPEGMTYDGTARGRGVADTKDTDVTTSMAA